MIEMYILRKPLRASKASLFSSTTDFMLAQGFDTKTEVLILFAVHNDASLENK